MRKNRDDAVGAVAGKGCRFQNDVGWDMSLAKIIQPGERTGKQNFGRGLRFQRGMILRLDITQLSKLAAHDSVLFAANDEKLARSKRLRN